MVHFRRDGWGVEPSRKRGRVPKETGLTVLRASLPI